VKSYDQHISLWQSTVEMHAMQLRRCFPSEERQCTAMRDAAAEVLRSIEKYKQLGESTASVSGDGSEWFDNARN
jgi:hypothetical protein